MSIVSEEKTQKKICDEIQHGFPESSCRIFRELSDRVSPKSALHFCEVLLDSSLVLDIGHIKLENRDTKFPFYVFLVFLCESFKICEVNAGPLTLPLQVSERFSRRLF